MALFQFACPYCSGPFAVEDPPAGQAIACPSCGAAVALPAELPSPAEPLPPAADPPLPAPQAPDESAAAADPLEFLANSSPPFAGSRRRSARLEPGPLRQLSRGERERRRLIRSLVLMAVGLIVLSIAVVVLSRF